MLSNTLNTNEIKNASAAEVEFTRLSTSGRTTEYAVIGEAPGLKHRMSIRHQESGTGTDARRRSVIRFDKTIAGQIDATKASTSSFYIVGDINIGNLAAMAEPKNVLAELMSFVATTGAANTVLFDCTGNGADVLINGGL